MNSREDIAVLLHECKTNEVLGNRAYASPTQAAGLRVVQGACIKVEHAHQKGIV